MAIIAAICLAGQAIFVRLATRTGSVYHVLFVTLVVNVVVLVPLSRLFTDEVTFTPIGVGAFVGAGIVAMLIGRMCYYQGIMWVGAARAEPLKASMPLYATIFAILFLGEIVTSLQILGVISIVAGLAVVSWDGAQHEVSIGNGVNWIGMALPLFAAVMFAIEPILAVTGLDLGIPILVGGAIKSVTAAVAVFILLVVRRDLPSLSLLRTSDFRWYVAAGLASVGMILSYYTGLSISRVAIVVPIMQTSPLVVTIVSAVFIGNLERVSRLLVIGSSIVVTGGILVTLYG